MGYKNYLVTLFLGNYFIKNTNSFPKFPDTLKGKTTKRFLNLLSFSPKLKSVLVNLNIWAKYRKYILVEVIRLTVAHKKPETLNNARYP